MGSSNGSAQRIAAAENRPYRTQTDGKTERFLQWPRRKCVLKRAYRPARTLELPGLVYRSNRRRSFRATVLHPALSRLEDCVGQRSWLRHFVLLVLAAVCGSVACGQAVDPPRSSEPDGPDDLGVMSFNIRYGTADDGENAWPLRRELVTRTIRHFGPDLLGVQEALRFQLDELGATLPEYREIGVGRDDGGEAGEYAAILFRAERFEPSASGTFWLSDRPETPGSVTWGNRIPRICTWATLRDLRSGVEILVVNAHLDHESASSRERAVTLIAARAANLRGQRAVILMGDFNTGPWSSPMAWLRGEAAAPWTPADLDSTSPNEVADGRATHSASPHSPGFRDAFAVAHPDSVDPGTYHGFTGEATGGRIDAILVSDEWEVREAGILRAAQTGRFPSDHFPVTAVLRPHR